MGLNAPASHKDLHLLHIGEVMRQSQYDLEEQDIRERYESGEIDSKQYHREMGDLEAAFYGEEEDGYHRW